MKYSNRSSISSRLLQQHSLLLVNEEAKMLDINDKLLLPSSTRLVKRRTSLLEKSRDWARRLITLHRPRRNTNSNEKIREINKQQNSSHNFDEDGYLSPMEIKANLDNITQENNNTNHHQSSINSYSNSNLSQLIYRYQDPNIQCTCQKRIGTTSFVSEFQKSLSIVDYIDFDGPDREDIDDPLESLKYLFNDNHGHFSRRIPRRSTNVSSISTDSGYSDTPISSSSKFLPVHLISCTLIPVNVTKLDSTNVGCLTCTCRPLSTTCLSNQQERKFSSYSSRQPLSHTDRFEKGINNQCACYNKYYSSMAIYPPTLATKSITKLDDLREKYYYERPQRRHLKKKRPDLMRFPSITDDLTSISRWYKPYLEREAVCDALQQADYGAFILRNSSTHSDCYALSIKVPKFTHDSNIVHYLIEKTLNHNSPSYCIKGTTKQFPTLQSLLTHHSVMPEILPITLNLNESFTI